MMKNASLFIVLYVASCNGVFYRPNSTKPSPTIPEGIELTEQEIPVESGIVLKSWIMRPTKEPIAGTVVQFHDYNENMGFHAQNVTWLANYGYQVVTFDYRGYGSSLGKPDRAGLIADGKAVTNLVCKNSDLGSKGIFILGQGLGGAVAIPAIAISQSHKCVRGIVLDSTFSSYRGLFQARLAENWITRLFQTPLSYLVSDEFSPKGYVNDLDTPLLFIHSRQDPTVPYSTGIDLFTNSHTTRKALWTLEETSHNTAFEPGSSQYREQLVRWFKSGDLPRASF